MADVVESKFNRHRSAEQLKLDWWTQSKGEVHKALPYLVDSLHEEQNYRRTLNRVNYSLFTGARINDLEADGYMPLHVDESMPVSLPRRISLAANSKLAKNKVRVLYMTEGGNWSQQARAKRMTKLINGCFYSSGFYDINPKAQLDACVFDVGAAYFYRDPESTTIQCERVPGHELVVDPVDARYGSPTQLYRRYTMPRRKLLAMYPGAAKIIREAPLSAYRRKSRSRTVSNCVSVYAGWILPSKPGAKDGKFAVCLDNGTLELSDYAHDYFPFVFHWWQPLPLGFYAASICTQVIGSQEALMRTVQDIQEHCDLSAGFIAIEAGSNVNRKLLTNLPWQTVEFSETPPTHVAPPAFQMEKLEWANWLISQGHEETGLSQLFVASRKPDGLDSGKALREYNDIGSERHLTVEQRYESSYVKAARIIQGLYEEAYEELGNFTVMTQAQKDLAEIDWEAARMDEDAFVVRPVPTSFLPSTPAAKFQTIQEMLQGGMIGREEAMLLLDYPDLERATSLQLAPILNIEWRIERMLDPDDPEYMEPLPLMNLPLAIKMVSSAYQNAQQGGAPLENLQLLEKFLRQAQYILEQEQQQAMAAEQAAQPPAGPAAPQQLPPPELMPPPLA